MKHFARSLRPQFLVLAVLACFAAVGTAAGAVAFSVSPAAITNDYQGKITLTITGLTPGQTVTVERFADLNGNGIVDAGEPLFRSASVTDGQVPLIGGVRNSNVPGDEDGATDGQVRVEFNYPGLDQTLDSIAGKYLFRVAGVVQPFEIRQKVLPQGVSGKLISAATGLPLPNTMVLLVSFNGPGGVGTVTDASGNYTNYIAPGSYTLLASGPGFVSDLAAGSVTVVTNVILSKSLTNVVSDRTISGRVSDSVSTAGIPGTFVVAQSTNNLLTLAFADSSGNYTLPVVASQWDVKPEESSGAAQGYIRLGYSQTTNTAAGSVANVNFQFSKANALVYGTIRDTQNTPVSGIGLYGNDNANTYDAGGLSDVNGNYSIGLLAGSVYVNLESDTLSQRGYVSSPSVNVTLTNGQAYATNFTLQRVTAHLIGRVVDINNGPIANVQVSANTQSGAGSQATTDANGNFDVGVIAGNWRLQLNNNDTFTQLRIVGPQLSLTVTDGVNQSGITMVVQHVTAQISGVVTNNTGTPISGVNVFANVTFNGTYYNASSGNPTDAGGNYTLGVFNNSGWQVGISNYQFPQGYAQPPNQTVNISGVNVTVNFSLSLIGPPQVTTTSLPGGVVSSSYNTQLQASGGQSPYTWSLISGSLPGGLSLASNGQISSFSGTATSAGTFTFTVRVTDNGARTTDQPLSITIAPSGPLGITTSSLSAGTAGSVYTTQLAASGGATPYVWSLSQGSGSLPPGLSISTTGIISGTPTTQGSYGFSVHVVDALLGTADRSLSISINPALQITATTLASGSVNSAYNNQLQASGGVSPYSWTVVSGTLPAGLTLSSGGSISGTPTSAGTFPFTVRVTDNGARTSDQPLSILINPAATGGSFWSYKPFMPTARVAPAAASIGGILYVVGGFTDATGAIGAVEAYDPARGAWSTLAALPTPRGRLAVGVINGRIYAAGGFGGQTALEIYDPVANSWTSGRSMNVSRSGAAAGVINNKLYVVGGTSSSTSTLEVYDPVSDTWIIKAPMPTPRYLLAAGVINGKLYAVGGANSVTGGSGLATLEVYDPATDTWANKAPMLTARADLAATVINGKLYAVGGFAQTQLEVYDPIADNWTSATPMPTARGDLAAAAVGDRLFAVGGTSAPGQTPLPLVEQYASSDTSVNIILKSDAGTLAAGLGSGAPSSATFNRLDAGDATGLTFQPALVGSFGTAAQVPFGAPPNSQLVNIPPGNGQNGFFKVTFVLPPGFSGVQLSFAANMDFYGRVFLNGNPISPSMTSTSPQPVNTAGNAMFSTANPAFFTAGTNEVLIADANSDGGSSGGAFYGFVTYPIKMTPLGFGSPGNFNLQLMAEASRSYVIEAATTLLNTNTVWIPLTTNTAVGGTINFTDPNPTNKFRFYRVTSP